ncbi:MAG TPA: DNA/RNA nuclease SfsA [Syntrophales bacterium]|nr:DNA/RNA nuclease SfsA [Syntrophales bacterium]
MKINAAGSTLPVFSATQLPILKARFVSRPNRFLVTCILDGKTVEAYLPNPGRLWELLLPGRALYLVKNPPDQLKSTQYTAMAVVREGRPILLHTHLANDVVAHLLASGRLPGFEESSIIRREAAVEGNRYDFLLEKDGGHFFLEVKSCTLFGSRIAMFPDAITDRGRRHLEHLARQARNGISGGVVFLVHSPLVEAFMPDYHTDYAFATTLLNVRNDLLIKAISVEWRDDLSLGPALREVKIPWDLVTREARDGGSYMLVLEMAKGRRIDVGGLGEVLFPKGYYVYTGSARASLTKRIERHVRKRKQFHWHIDTLRDHAGSCKALPVRSSEDLEHDLALALGIFADWTIPRFGSSDCKCPTHLFGFREDPLRAPQFIEMLLKFRIERLDEML